MRYILRRTKKRGRPAYLLRAAGDTGAAEVSLVSFRISYGRLVAEWYSDQRRPGLTQLDGVSFDIQFSVSGLASITARFRQGDVAFVGFS